MKGRSDAPETTDSDGLQGFDDHDLKLGDLMRGERATMGKSLLDVQREIKIKAGYLAAIEDADLSAFETPGFIAGYVRSYARYLGMDPDRVYRVFCKESGFSHVAGLDAMVYAKTGSGRSAGPVQKSAGRSLGASDAILARSPIHSAPSEGIFSGIQAGAVGSFLVLAALVAGLGYGGWSVLKEIQKVKVTPVETQMSALPATTGTSGATELAGGLADQPPSAEALERLYRPKTLDKPVLIARDGPIATLDPRGQGAYANYASPAPSVPVDLAAGDSLKAAIAETMNGLAAEEAAHGELQLAEAAAPKVMLLARRPVWVRVRAADGSILLEKILEEGELYVLPDSDEPPTLRAGNSGSLYFVVNGETMGPAGPGTSVAKNVILSAEAIGERYDVADLTEDPDLARFAQLAVAPQAGPVAAPQATE